MIKFIIDLPPRPKERPRFGGRHGQRGHAYTPQATRRYEALAAARAREVMAGRPPIPKGTPLRIRVLAVFEVPKSWSQKRRQAAIQGCMRHTTKPDFDNSVKSVCDAFNNIVYADDSQICSSQIDKVYGEKACIKFFIEEIPLYATSEVHSLWT